MEDLLLIKTFRLQTLQSLQQVLFVNFQEDTKRYLKENFWDLIDLMEEKWGQDLLDLCLISTIQL